MFDKLRTEYNQHLEPSYEARVGDTVKVRDVRFDEPGLEHHLAGLQGTVAEVRYSDGWVALVMTGTSTFVVDVRQLEVIRRFGDPGK